MSTETTVIFGLSILWAMTFFCIYLLLQYAIDWWMKNHKEVKSHDHTKI
jgi:hypothetical protein